MASSQSLMNVHQTFRAWFGDDYDLDAIDLVLSAAAVEKLDGDPLWVLIISGSGNAKTETVGSLENTGAFITSTITGEGALLSGTSKRDRVSGSTGGLLYKIGSTGLLVIKDFTSILSMSRDARSSVLAALREIYDGRWERNMGTDGGLTLTWEGRIGLIGAVTTEWDRAQTVVAAMGDRFVALRMDSRKGRVSAGQHAMRNVGFEREMRDEIRTVVAALLNPIERGTTTADLTPDDEERLFRAADIVTLCRTAVELDPKGEVVDAHAPEMPTRFTKQLVQIVRGGLTIGLSHHQAVTLALRCARDSMPPTRLAILLDVGDHRGTSIKETQGRLNQPYTSVRRQFEALRALKVLSESGEGRFYVIDDVDPKALTAKPDLATPGDGDREENSPEHIGDIAKSGFVPCPGRALGASFNPDEAGDTDTGGNGTAANAEAA